MAVELKPVHRSIGMEAMGVDLSEPLSDADFTALQGAVHRAGFVLLRGQDMSAAAQMALAERFGIPLPPYRPEFSHPDFHEIAMLGNVAAGGKVVTYLNTGGIEWHTDSPGSSFPPGVSMLYCVESDIPDGGGETLFASTVAGYEVLPDAIKSRLDDLIIVHSFNTFNDVAATHDDTSVTAQSGALRDRNKDSHDPIVQTHPATGERHLYVSHSMVKGVSGMALEEGMELIMDVVGHVTAPDLVYRHVWRPGDLVVFDNRGCLHTPTSYDFLDYPRTRRLLRHMIIGARA